MPKLKVLLQQQKSQIEDAITKAQADNLSRCAQENQILLSELDEILQPIIDSCTKDSISNGNYEVPLEVFRLNWLPRHVWEFYGWLARCEVNVVW